MEYLSFQGIFCASRAGKRGVILKPDNTSKLKFLPQLDPPDKRQSPFFEDGV
jgi:hypothetical protein